MVRFIKVALVVGALAGALVTANTAHAELIDSSRTGGAPPALDVNEDLVMSIGAETTMNDHDAVVVAPGKGKIVASANADIFCSGDETARTLVINVNEAGNVMLDLCEAHLERREMMIRFVSE